MLLKTMSFGLYGRPVHMSATNRGKLTYEQDLHALCSGYKIQFMFT
jgi:hypothetical protein